MSEKTIYVARAVGGAIVMRMPKHTLGQHYTQTEGKNGVIYIRPVKVECVREENIEKMTEKEYEAAK